MTGYIACTSIMGWYCDIDLKLEPPVETNRLRERTKEPLRPIKMRSVKIALANQIAPHFPSSNAQSRFKCFILLLYYVLYISCGMYSILRAILFRIRRF